VLSTQALGGNYTANAKVVGCVGPGKNDTSASAQSYFRVLAGSALGRTVSYFDIAEEVQASEEVLGTSDFQPAIVAASCGTCVWWQLLALQLAILLTLYTFWKNTNKYLMLVGGLVSTLVILAIYHWFNQGCVSEFWGCKWFWIESLGVFLATTLVFFRKKAVY
jgi:hypothetical protein